MAFQKLQATEVLEYVEGEGNPEIFVAPLKKLPDHLELPQRWRELVLEERAEERVSEHLWTQVRSVLPRTVAAITQRL
ncbi:MAG: hypothetical protein JO159_15065, partial [Acidobacteria bacterium]|nr:hypothetical protein [Acidobacteriota bacterium]